MFGCFLGLVKLYEGLLRAKADIDYLNMGTPFKNEKKEAESTKWELIHVSLCK